MGVESYFIDVKLSGVRETDAWKTFFTGKGFSVSPYVEKYGGCFRKKAEADNKIVVDGLVLLSWLEDCIFLEACFSCYRKALSIMFRILSSLNDCNAVKYLYYGTTQFDPQELSLETIFTELNSIYQKRYNDFKENYTAKEVAILPGRCFYQYYNRHRKALKAKEIDQAED